LMRELLGETDFKPFECVGTFKETRAAFYLSLMRAKKENAILTPLLAIFERDYMPKYRGIERDSRDILAAWDKKHNLPKIIQKTVKNALSRRE